MDDPQITSLMLATSKMSLDVVNFVDTLKINGEFNDVAALNDTAYYVTYCVPIAIELVRNDAEFCRCTKSIRVISYGAASWFDTTTAERAYRIPIFGPILDSIGNGFCRDEH